MVTGLLWTILAFAVLVTLVVGLHELGHAWVARWLGVPVKIFSIGFGSVLWCWRDRRGTQWRVSALPLGGYVAFGPPLPSKRLIGLMDLPIGSWSKVAIASAGPLMNLISAWLFVLVSLCAISIRSESPLTVMAVEAGSPAAEAMLEPGDVILGVNDHSLETAESLVSLLSVNPPLSRALSVQRGGERLTAVVVPEVVTGEDGLMRGRIGVRLRGDGVVFLGVGDALWRTTELWWAMVRSVVDGWSQWAASAFSTEGIQGMVGIAQTTGHAAAGGVASWFGWLALISVHLGLLNLLPVPPLDGWHILRSLMQEMRISIPLRVEFFLLRAGIFLLLGLMVLGLWADMRRSWVAW